ncbi:hypothetical protein GO308_09805 [Sphingomonas sp. SFZ2018-12]|uniref:helix-turn-helix domain-containing protein n=1 Tax=Sphingomonas sp. SFZ2018-12 TaxID=2683197 RepID=UPI001F114FE5|nr:helix-turn-helix transcriptional regulator [Sphingomonas sp. SFZ2018-12]MCH4893403.1 hypothetical protein [Sphingomonas sp. SFZ2018-12]
MPEYIRLLAIACDRSNQRAVAERLGKSSGYVSRIINRRYAGSYVEAETLIRAAYGADEVDCPLFGEIPLASCVHNRRRKPPFVNSIQHHFAATCPSCAFNTDAVGSGRRDAA